MIKRNLLAVIISVAALVVLIAVAAIPLLASISDTHANGLKRDGDRDRDNRVTTIKGLARISTIGSTQFIVDGKGHTANVDPNPYDVQIVPPTDKTPANAPAGMLRAGDLVATNIGNEDKGNTVVTFPDKVGPGHQFNVADDGLMGAAKEAFNTQTGTLWVTNFNGNNVKILNPNGTLMTTVTNALFKNPWGIAFNDGFKNPQAKSMGSFFVGNAGDATIDRIDIVADNGARTFKVTQIAKLTPTADQTKIALAWAPQLRINDKWHKDVLLALDPANNRVAAFPNSTTMEKFTDQGLTAFKGKPLNNPGGLALNPINNDLLVVNLNDNNLVELNAAEGKVVGTRLVDNVPVDPQSGNGSALFGVTAGKDKAGNLVVYYTDDNMGTVNMLSAS
jgi:DNA-binding beta-propeller fold protein YncE